MDGEANASIVLLGASQPGPVRKQGGEDSDSRNNRRDSERVSKAVIVHEPGLELEIRGQCLQG